MDANSTRKNFIANAVLSRDTEVVRSYRLVMKEGSDNICASAMQGVMKRLNAERHSVLVARRNGKATISPSPASMGEALG